MWLDLRRKASRAAVHFQHALNVGLYTGCREHAARRGLDFFAQLVVLEGAVALEDHAVDDRVFDDADNQVILATVNRHVGEQVGGEERLKRQVDPVRIERVTGFEQQVGLHRTGFDTLVALNDNRADRAAIAGIFLGMRCSQLASRSERQDAGRENCCCEEFTHSRILFRSWS